MLEIFGTLAKEERLKTVDHFILPNSFVLENLEPYPGYHGENLPSDKAPDTFFLVTTESYPNEKIMRISHKIKTSTNIQFDGSVAFLHFKNEVYPAIRVRDLKSYQRLQEVQNLYYDEGIHFMKSKIIDSIAYIELKKVFLVEKINDNIFRDANRSINYLKIPAELTWNHFKEISHKVKNNLDNRNFDVALIVMYGREVYDFIRVYSEEISIDHLEEIRLKYLDVIKRSE
jgi:hypothetical protein